MLPAYNDLSDFELTSLIRQDDHRAYQELYLRYTDILYTHAYSRLQDREEARDLVQEVFSTLWVKRDSIDYQLNISGYLYVSVRNRVLNFIAHEKRRSKYLGSLMRYAETAKGETDSLVRTNQLRTIIEREVENMPEKMREIFRLSRMQHLSHREIAQKLGITEKTVKNQVNGALKILRTRLGLFQYLQFLFL